MKLHKMTDEECLKKFLEMLETRVEITTGFVIADDGNITHQVLQVTCGDYVSVSQPEPLEMVLRPATADEQNIIIN